MSDRLGQSIASMAPHLSGPHEAAEWLRVDVEYLLGGHQNSIGSWSLEQRLLRAAVLREIADMLWKKPATMFWLGSEGDEP